MKAAANGRFLSRRVTGVERYGRELVQRLQPNLRIISSPPGQSGISGHLWEQFRLPGLLRADEVLWSPANSGPLAVRNQVLSLHDLSALEHPEWYSPLFGAWYRLLIPLLVRRVKRIVVPSSFVGMQLQERFPLPDSALSIVPGGVDRRRFWPDAPRPDRLPEHYVLFVGSLQPRKNLRALLQAWETLSRDPKPAIQETHLVIAGDTESVFRRESLPGQLERVHWLGYVPESYLPGLYAGAEVFVMPSLEEGFGLTILEAMACGTAVIASRAGALPEVAGEAALFFDPAAPGQLQTALEQVLNDQSLKALLSKKGQQQAAKFSWERSAHALWGVIESCQ